MGAVSTNNSGTTFLSIIGGNLTKRVDKGTPGAVARIIKTGKEVHEVQFDAFTGFLRDIEFEKHEQFGWQVKIVIGEKGETTKITIPRSGDYFRDFAMCLLNFSPNRIAKLPFAVTAFDYIQDNGKTSGYLRPMVYENGTWQKVGRFFTKEKPGDLPEWEQVEDPKTGEMTWSSLKQQKFLSEKVYNLMEEAKAIGLCPDSDEVPAYGTPVNLQNTGTGASEPEEVKAPNPLFEEKPIPSNVAANLGLDDDDDDGLPF